MDSANGHHQNHRLQDQVQRRIASLAAPSSYGTGGNREWQPNIMLDAGNSNNFLTQDLGHHWDYSGSGSRLMNKSTSEFLNSPPSIIDYPFLDTGSDMRSGHKGLNTNVSEKLLFESLASGHQVCSNAKNCGPFSNAGMSSRGKFSQIYPSVNISNQLNPSFPAMPISIDMNLQALDLFNPTRFTGSLSQHSQDELGKFRDQMQHLSSDGPWGDANFINGITDTKRTSILLEPKGPSSPTATAKKSRLGSRASCTPFKVRKEKLGDRVAALQQLVAPFGKTDTASVLMEAIGYIKFLQNQVETLSVPYMKSKGNRKGKAMRGGSTIELEDHHQAKRDLRSRGLCLVPMSCMSYITGDSNNANFGAETS